MTKSIETEVGILKSQMDDVKSALGDMKVQISAIDVKIDGLSNNFITRTEFLAYKALEDSQSKEKKDTSKLIKESLIKTIVPILLVGLMFVIVAYINYTVLKVPRG